MTTQTSEPMSYVTNHKGTVHLATHQRMRPAHPLDALGRGRRNALGHGRNVRTLPHDRERDALMTPLGFEMTTLGIAQVLDIDSSKLTIDEAQGTVTLNAGQAARLVTLAKKYREAWAVLDEVEGVELLAALNIAAQVAAVVGDKIQADHFQGIYGKFAQAPSGVKP